jgi:hypothetical protein
MLKERIILIDNYTDESAITRLSKKEKGANVALSTINISKTLGLDVARVNAQ